MPSSQIIIGVPGLWQSHRAIVQAIAGDSGGFLFAGRILMDINTRQSWEMEIYEHDPALQNAFGIAGHGSITREELNAISRHTFTAYVIGMGGSSEAAQSMLGAVCGLLRAGGIAAKVESAGKAHSRKDWMALADANSLRALYNAYVTLIRGSGEVYSCGMHNLGLPDASVHLRLTNEENALLLETFLLYTLLEKPDLRTGHTFSLNPQSPSYRLLLEPCKMFKPDDPFHNPYGVWRLMPA